VRSLTAQRPAGPRQPADLLATLTAELVAAGTLSGGVTRSRVVTGPLLSRVALSSAGGEHLMLDIARTNAPRVPWLADAAGCRIGSSDHPAPADTVTAVLARTVGPQPIRAWYHPTPWAPAMLAEVATGSAAGPLPAPATFAALGAALARVHAGAGAADYRLPPPLQRTRQASDRLTAEQRAILDRIMAGHDPVVPVHGQPALAHVLVPDDPVDSVRAGTTGGRGPGPGTATAAAVLTGWSPWLGGSAALDLGHLLGDMTEIAVLAGLSDPARGAWLRSRLVDVRDGYRLADGPFGSDPQFWARVADGAVLRLLDHRCTLVGLLGPDAAPVAIADRVAAHLASPAFRAQGFRP
jgi:hypothetical protein